MNSKSEIDVKLNNELYSQRLIICSDYVRVKQIITNLMRSANSFIDAGSIELWFKVGD